jgi:hypothetical protein
MNSLDRLMINDVLSKESLFHERAISPMLL